VTLDIRELDGAAPDYQARLSALLDRALESRVDVEETVRGIIARVRQEGDAALLDYTRRLDRFAVARAQDLELPRARLDAALAGLPPAQREALEEAAARIRRYHERQRQESWEYTEPDGTVLGQKVTPVDRAGLYVPGGKAAYPSSVLMNAIPAKVAGVPELVMTVPAPEGTLNELVLAAASLAGVDRVFTVGGAQAVAALAYGTETVPVVDKIVGPGNAWVAAAKRQVFGRVGIDMIAGPSEVVVVCDANSNPDWVAMDLCAQAEHDELAQAIAVSTDAAALAAVRDALARIAPTLERARIVQSALAEHGALIRVRDLDQAAATVNRIAPEHLELMLADARGFAAKIRHAGAMFLGAHSAEVLGDYCAGPNHVLPTSGSARFSSPLGVYDFQKRTSLIECSPAGAGQLARISSTLARAESLTAHARAAEYRLPCR
jgi:histidinol dehydrogenase